MSNNFKNLIKRIEQLEAQIQVMKNVSGIRVQIIDQRDADQLHVCHEIFFTKDSQEMTESEADYFVIEKKEFENDPGLIKFPE